LIVCGLMHQPLDMAWRSGLLKHLKEHLQPDLSSSLALAVRLSADPAR
jgi:SulP family sulfate permease